MCQNHFRKINLFGYFDYICIFEVNSDRYRPIIKLLDRANYLCCSSNISHYISVFVDTVSEMW